ncbi:hypothetical protein PIB30_000462 [Stylosanthes scabra]|uniref:Uncharacterized protein n=1 Tax=Stylosanthes scabra TaxID=79078 RepID=A0ABU6V1H1_9FABA|nr:hypothetical protein [Stylosanthes scabra]
MPIENLEAGTPFPIGHGVGREASGNCSETALDDETDHQVCSEAVTAAKPPGEVPKPSAPINSEHRRFVAGVVSTAPESAEANPLR